jgi:hypothetical protein
MAEKNIYKIPNFPPYNDSNFKAAWVRIKSREVKHHTALATEDNDGGLILGDWGPEWQFLAPESVMESLNHTWEPWETIASRLAGKGKEFQNMLSQATSIIEAFKSSNAYGDGLDQTVSNLFKNISGQEKPNYKVDTPLVYENTERREWTMQFNLTSVDLSTQTEMIEAVNWLRNYTLPVRNAKYYGLGIELPYIFEVYIEGSDSFDVQTKYCAITSFQPTFLGPYIKYYNPNQTSESTVIEPSRVELTLTFKEISPRYATTHEIPVY